MSFVAWSYGLKFGPSMAVLLLCYGATLRQLCPLLAAASTPATPHCHWVYPAAVNGSVATLWAGWDQPSGPHSNLHHQIQHGVALAFVVYLGTSSRTDLNGDASATCCRISLTRVDARSARVRVVHPPAGAAVAAQSGHQPPLARQLFRGVSGRTLEACFFSRV